MKETIGVFILKLFLETAGAPLKGKISRWMNSNMIGHKIILVEMKLFLTIGSRCAEILADLVHKEFLLLIS